MKRRLTLCVEELESRLAPDAGLMGEYYNTIDLQQLASTRVDAIVNFTEADWGNAPPGTGVTPDDNYSERWTGFVHTPTAGNWTFYTNSNDGVRLWIDNNQVINNWNQHVATENSATLNLTAGWHAVRLEHFQQNGTVVIQLSFSGPGQAKTIIPSSHLSTTNPDAGLPVANAGPDQTVVLPANSVTLNGSATDDGTITSYQWSQVSGPNSASLSGASTPNLTAGNLVQGSYVFRLTVTDNDGNTDSDDAAVNVINAGGAVQITGDLLTWHAATLTFDGPSTSETAGTNPFLDYRLNVTFTGPSGQVYVAPGYFAADGNAANTSSTSGNKWRVHFVPDQAGSWSFQASFRTGSNIAIDLDPSAGTATGFDGTAGGFTINPSNPSSGNPIDRGMVRYVGEHYLQYAGSGDYFIKGGADSPENFLGYWEFDNTFDNGGTSTPGLIDGLHRFAPHVSDWNAGDPTWQNGEGKGIIGALNYLASEGINSVYFLTYNIDGGDGQDTWMWTSTGERLRFDVSKLAQWEIVFSHMDALGIQLHVVTSETENDFGLDNGNLGTTRKLYYRELVARFGHHQNIIWNIGEENDNSDAQRKQYADYIRSLDPYDHPITVHTHYGNVTGTYDGLVGDPNFEATSIQGDGSSYNTWAIQMRDLSAQAGRKWAIYGDEQGPAVDDQMNNLTQLRRDALWGNLMGGGAGVEWYFGYQGTFGDVQSENWQVADPLWDMTRHALSFFQNHLPFVEMSANNALTSTTSDYVFAKAGEVYAIFLKTGGTTNLDLTGVTGTFSVQWYNPRTGGALQNGTITQVSGGGQVSIGQAPSDTGNDWAVLVQRTGGVTPPAAPSGLSATAVSSSQINLAWTDNSNNETGFEIQRASDSGFSQNVVNTNAGSNAGSLQATGLSASTTYFFRVRAVNSGGVSAWSNTASATTQPASGGQQPFLGSPFTVGSIIQAEDFDTGGEGVAYHDTTAGNSGNSTYRNGESVDLQTTTDSGGGVNVGWIKAGEWLEYTVNVASAGTYQVEARIASNGAGGTFHAEFDGVNQTGVMTIGNTSGWQRWQTITSGSFNLSAGTQVLRIALDSNGSTGFVGNFNWFRIVAVATAPAAPSGLSASAVSASQINLAWTDNSNNETGFEVQRATNSTFTQNLVASNTGANATILQATGLSASTTYYFRVRAVNAAGASAWSSTASAATQPAPAVGAVTSFTLINADTDEEIATILDGQTINLAALPTRNLSIRANVSGTVESVRLVLDGGVIARTENAAPYSLTGDSNGDYNPWTPSLGSHTLTATPYTLDNLGGQQGTALTITFNVIDDPSNPFMIFS